MQESVTLFLTLLVAHLLGDFVFQTRRMVDGKASGDRRAYLRHGAVHLAAAYLAILLFLPAWLAGPRLHVTVLAIVVLHLGCDYLKERPLRRASAPPWLAFLADQAVHVAALVLTLAIAFPEFRQWLVGIQDTFALRRERILWLLVVYLATVFGGGFLIRLLLPTPEEDIGQERRADVERREKELRLGMYVGWLERFLVMSAILAKSPTAAGLIIAAKSVVRFKKLEKSDEFAEYFLLGTFLSMLLAFAGGLALRWLLWGNLDLE